MKKLLLVLSLFVLVSCSKDDVKPINQNEVYLKIENQSVIGSVVNIEVFYDDGNGNKTKDVETHSLISGSWERTYSLDNSQERLMIKVDREEEAGENKPFIITTRYLGKEDIKEQVSGQFGIGFSAN